jgi:hypothetical protein
MNNAHLWFGWLTYVRSTEKTTTSIKLHLDSFVGELLPDPPRQAKAQFISVVGGDTQISAISAAISMGDRFMGSTHPSMPGAKCAMFQRLHTGSGARNRCGTSWECPRNLPPQACRRIRAKRSWLAPTVNSSGFDRTDLRSARRARVGQMVSRRTEDASCRGRCPWHRM